MKIYMVVEGHWTKNMGYALRKRGRWAGGFILRPHAKPPKVISWKPAQTTRGGPEGSDFLAECEAFYSSSTGRASFNPHTRD